MHRIEPSTPEPSESLYPDCEMLTAVLHRIMKEKPEWTAETAFTEVKRMVGEVMIIDWEQLRVSSSQSAHTPR